MSNRERLLEFAHFGCVTFGISLTMRLVTRFVLDQWTVLLAWPLELGTTSLAIAIAGRLVWFPAVDRSPLRLIEIWATLLPMRVVSEDLGDYVDEVNRLRREGRYKSSWACALSALIWTSINAVGYTLRQLGRAKA